MHGLQNWDSSASGWDKTIQVCGIVGSGCQAFLSATVGAGTLNLARDGTAVALDSASEWLSSGKAAGSTEALVAGGASQASGQGFRSFSAFKRALGPAGPGLHWHHIVEQTPGNVASFGAQTIHSLENLVRIEAGVHTQVSAYYSRIQPFTSGQTVRQWLGTQSLETQQQFGLQVLRDFGVLP